MNTVEQQRSCPAPLDSKKVTGADIWWTAGALAASVLATVISIIALGIFFPDMSEINASSLGSFVGGVIFALSLYVTLVKRGWSLHDLGLRKPSTQIWKMILLVGVLTPVLVILTLAASSLIGQKGNSDAVIEPLKEASIWVLVLFTFHTTVLAPVCEEIVFRRIFTGYAVQSLPFVASVVIVSLFFGLAHMSVLSIVPLAILGAWASFVSYKFQSLWAGIWAHSVNNFLAASTLWAFVWA